MPRLAANELIEKLNLRRKLGLEHPIRTALRKATEFITASENTNSFNNNIEHITKLFVIINQIHNALGTNPQFKQLAEQLENYCLQQQLSLLLKKPTAAIPAEFEQGLLKYLVKDFFVSSNPVVRLEILLTTYTLNTEFRKFLTDHKALTNELILQCAKQDNALISQYSNHACMRALLFPASYVNYALTIVF